MNLIRKIAKQITRWTLGLPSCESHSLQSWRFQPLSLTPKNFQISNNLVSDNLCFAIYDSRSSGNLALLEPQNRGALEVFTALKIVACENIKIPILAISKTSISEFEGVNFSENHVRFFSTCTIYLYKRIDTFHKVSLKDILVNYDISQASENLFKPLGISQTSDIFFLFNNPSILDCCFSGNIQESYLIQSQELLETQKEQKISRRKSLLQPPSYCEILHPILLPPLLPELDNSPDFYNPLRDYQKQGIRFLFDNPSALLADEMGTGKTVQTVIALQLLFRQGAIKSALIICPIAVIGSVELSIETGNSEGWSGHLYHWSPELKVAIMRGSKKEQRKVDWQKIFHVYITTYETLRIDLSDEAIVNLAQFDCIILDEAQKVKNRDTKTARAIRQLQSNYRWALTGTPIENRLDDVVSLFDFIRPGMFSKGTDYTPQDISNAIRPFILRRLKKDVLKDLPDKARQEIWLDLDDEQKTAYAQALSLGRKKIENFLIGETPSPVKKHIFALYANLTQICNFSKKKTTSPKTDTLLDLIETIAANGEKVLVFSQYRIEGTEKIAQLLTQKGIKYTFYQGSLQQKEQAVNNFRNNPEITVFLATIQTAGYGITLTEATYVIHFDHPWNPAKLQNAEDRIHRIGQVKGVTIYSFWMRGTIEERIKKKLIEKHGLIENTINCLATGIDEDELLSTEDWLDVFDIKITKKSAAENEETRNDKRIRRIDEAKKLFLELNQNNLAPPLSFSSISHQLEQIKQVLKTMTDSPQRIFNIKGNYIEKVEGGYHEHNYAPEPKGVDASQQLSLFLSKLRAQYPNATDAEIFEILTKSFERMPQHSPHNWNRWRDVFSIIFVGATEGTKVFVPIAGVPIEVLKRLYEIYQRNSKLPEN
ncbi:MAG TPA: DEAD/DEAH box helicase [Leptolyngbyaceae cyanobacterium]